MATPNAQLLSRRVRSDLPDSKPSDVNLIRINAWRNDAIKLVNKRELKNENENSFPRRTVRCGDRLSVGVAARTGH